MMQKVDARFIKRDGSRPNGNKHITREDFVPMKCPSCDSLLETPDARCPSCKLSLQRLDMKFGLVPRHSRFLTDRTGRIAMNDMAQLRAALRLFEKKFPQILFSIFIDDLPDGSSISEFAFWMANRARFSSLEKKAGDNFDILLVVDLATRSAALTTGYGLEPYVQEEDLNEMLNALVLPLRDGRPADGIRALLDALVRRLREISKRAGKRKAAEVRANAIR